MDAFLRFGIYTRVCQLYGSHGINAACGDPGTWHVRRSEAKGGASVVCDAHLAVVLRGMSSILAGIHPLGADCGMPGVLWFVALNRCCIPPEIVES